MGSVYQRKGDGRWVAVISIGPRTDRRNRTRYVKSKAEGEAWLAEVEGPRHWRSVDRTGDCWTWLGSLGQGGYGLAWDGTRRRIASRYIYEREIGSIPEGLQVLHRCDNPPCVRPDHLFLGTPLDNVHDMIAKGRASWQKPMPRGRKPVRLRSRWLGLDVLAIAERRALPLSAIAR